MQKKQIIENEVKTERVKTFVKDVWSFKIRNVLPFAKEGAIIWIVNFIVSEILISGGRNERNIYIGILYLIFSVALVLLFNLKKPSANLYATLYRGGSALVTYAILDYLVITLLLEKNSFAVYRFWGLIATYGAILVLPVLIYLAKNYISSRIVKT